MRPLLAAALLAGLATTPALAQSPIRLNGTIASLAPGAMVVALDDGSTQPVLLQPGTRYGTQVERSLADIRPGEFVGSAAVRGADGRLHAQEVHIFPETMRGTGEGHRPMDQPEQTMTNANVDGVAEAPSGPVLTLTYPGGAQTIDVAPGTRVVGVVPGDASLLVPGAAVTIRATRAPDGAVTAIAVQAEAAGVKPLP